MPLIPPSLDDRSYDDIVGEMLANIPAHTPEWTNPQPGDPGRTLIELFAWLADTVLYRANLIPEKQRLAFLKLLGRPLQPAVPATGLVALSLDPAAVTAARIVAPATLPGAVPFETLGEMDLLPIAAQAYVKVALTDDQKKTAMPLLSGLKQLYSLPTLPSGYTTTPVFANNLADPAGIDVMNDTTDRSLWLALLAAKPENVAAAKAAMSGVGGQQYLNVGFAPSFTVADLYSVPQGYTSGVTAAPVQASWQLSQPTQPGQPTLYTTLKTLSDTTSGLTQAGVVRLVLPPGALIGAPSNDVRKDSQAGVGMKPPRIDDAGIAARLVAWVRLSVQSSLRVSWAGVNAVQIDQRRTYSSIIIGVSDGSASQRFTLPQAQVDPATFVLAVDMPGVGLPPWQQVDDLSALRGPVPAYVLDPEAGTVAFGNQLQGMIVPAGRRIQVTSMRAGGSAAGNLPAGSLTSIQAFDPTGARVTQSIGVQQPFATTGGADAETLAAAEQRLPALLRHQDRAVTVGDYRDLVREIPGSGIARVEVLPLFKPQTRTPDVPGVISVMVIPQKQEVLNPCPRADRPLLQTAYRYLAPRAPATVELYVVASDYVGFGLSVAVEVKTGFGLLQVSQAVELALRTYLWPIGGGPAATGWPLGRHVRSLELEVIVSQVPGVIEVNGLRIFVPMASGGYAPLAADASGAFELTLEGWQLPEALDVLVVAGLDGSGIDVPATLSGEIETDTSVAVPIVPVVC